MAAAASLAWPVLARILGDVTAILAPVFTVMILIRHSETAWRISRDSHKLLHPVFSCQCCEFPVPVPDTVVPVLCKNGECPLDVPVKGLQVYFTGVYAV